MFALKLQLLVFFSLTFLVNYTESFTPSKRSSRKSCLTELLASTDPSLASTSEGRNNKYRICRARDLVLSLVQEEKCFTTESGARSFVDACAANAVIEDRFYPQPFNGKTEIRQYAINRVKERQGKGDVRIDNVSDGDKACGFAWTWTCGNEEGLRGTTYVELNDGGEIQYIQEIPEPIFKPGNATRQLLEVITRGAEKKPAKPLEKRTPTIANELAKYLFIDLQNTDEKQGTYELMRFFDENVIYRDFNFEEALMGPAEVRKFVEGFSFPGIECRPLRFDDGQDKTCFTWEVVLEGAEDTIKGMSFYELDPKTRKIVYVRDVPESAIKPPILGKLARQIRPGLGVFIGVPIGSRLGGK